MSFKDVIFSPRHRHMWWYVVRMNVPSSITDRNARKAYKKVVLTNMLRRDGVKDLPSTTEEEKLLTGQQLRSANSIDVHYGKWLKHFHASQKREGSMTTHRSNPGKVSKRTTGFR